MGGHCLAVDPYFIVAKAPETARLIDLSRSINTSMPYYVVESVNTLMEKAKGKIITVFGLTYKGNVDDIRESPAMEILEILKEQGEYEVRAYDPHVKKDFVFADIEEAVDHSDLILILSDHDEFKELDWSHLTKMSTKQIFDTKNIVKNRSNDFKYINFGNLHESTNKEKILV